MTTCFSFRYGGGVSGQRSDPKLDLTGAAFLPSLPRHRHDLSREQVQASQAGRIVLGAAEVIAERGYAAATVTEITRRVGVSRKTFYELFADKEEVFLAAYKSVEPLVEYTAAALTAAANSDESNSGTDPVLVATTTLLDTLSEYPALTRMFFLEALGAGPRIRLRRDEAIDQFAQGLAPFLAAVRSADRPDLEPIDQALARAILSAGVEAIVAHLVRNPSERLSALAPDLAQIIRRLTAPNGGDLRTE